MCNVRFDFYNEIKTSKSELIVSITKTPLLKDEKGFHFIDVEFLILKINEGSSKSTTITIGRFYLAGDINDPETRDFMRRLNKWVRKANTYLQAS